MRCLMAAWSSQRGTAAGNMDESAPPLAPSCSTNTASAQWWMKQAGDYLALFMGAESALPVCPHTAQWMHLHGGGKKKYIWHWNELHTCNSSFGDGKWLHFVIWTFQRWKWGRPPEVSRAGLLIQSCSSSCLNCWFWSPGRDFEWQSGT